MGEVVRKEPCPNCRDLGRDNTGDNLVIYDDGSGYCFSCESYFVRDSGGVSMLQEGGGSAISLPQITYKAIPRRGITERTARHYGYGITKYKNQIVHAAIYRDKAHRPVAYHTRGDNKQFRWLGDSKSAGFFGQHLFNSGRRLVITEGEIDCLSIAQLQDCKWPVVSIKSGANSAKNDLKANMDWLLGFEEIILCFDMDEVGQKAAQECALLLPPGRAKIAALPFKDANECLLKNQGKELLNALWNAQAYRPDGIRNGQELYDRCKTPPVAGLDIPYPQLNEMIKGIRPKELYLFTAGSGIGKSTLGRELLHHLHQEYKVPCGVLALEESVEKTGRFFIGYYLNKPINIEGVNYSDEEYDEGFAATIGRGDWWVYEHFGSSDITTLINKIRYLVVGLGVKVVLLDHISIIVSGLDEVAESERKMIDKLMTELRTLIEETGVTILAIVHLKRPDKGKSWNEGRQVSLSDLRGSGGLEQMSDVVIAMERNQQHTEDGDISHLRVLKNRPIGVVGPADSVIYIHDTGRLMVHSGFTSEPYDPANENTIEEDFRGF